MTAQLKRRKGSTVDVVDMFSGWGGTSQGVIAAGADLRLAINHDEHSIDVHALNFPTADHLRADLLDEKAARYADPALLPAARALCASPSCRQHSQANAKKIYTDGPTLFNYDQPDKSDDRAARSERSRTTMMCPLRYAAAHAPEVVMIENVVEVVKWGPNQDGSTFRWWMAEWDRLGYVAQPCYFNSGFFPPTPQSRDRAYFVFHKRGNLAPDLRHRPDAFCTSDRCGGAWVTAEQSWRPRKKTWPAERWGRWGKQYDYRCRECAQVVVPVAYPAATAIDWTNLGPKIGDRVKPLAPKTLDRIRRGMHKFQDFPRVSLSPTGEIAAILATAAGNTSERAGQRRARPIAEQMFSQTGTLTEGLASMPFIVEMRGGGSIQSGQHPITDQMHTVTAGGLHHGLTFAGHTKINGGPTDTAWHGADDQLGTITGANTTGLISMTVPLVHGGSDDRFRHTFEQLATLTASRERYVATTEPGDLDVDNVHFRMLDPSTELRKAMAFPDSFEMLGNKTQITRGMGNAVTPPVATWIMDRMLSTLG